MTRVWAMPTKDTFQCQPIGDFVERYLAESTVSIDPFARNCQWATYTNDLNPNTRAERHEDAAYFLEALRSQGMKPDLVLFDPPYSPRQVKECYEGIGLTMTQQDGHRTHGWTPERNIINDMIVLGGVVLSFGWNSMGMGKGRGFEMEELLLVCHGAGHSDTICVAERKIVHQDRLL